MYTIVDLCLLCHTNNKNLKSIVSKDSDGILIQEKLRVFLFELVNMELEIAKYICLHCLQNLNQIYNFKQLCLRNIINLNNYIRTLKKTEDSCENLQVTLIDIKYFKLKKENDIKSEPTKTENLNLDNVIVNSDPNEDGTGIEYVLQGKDRQRTEQIEKKLRNENYVTKEAENVTDNNDNNKIQKVEANIINENLLTSNTKLRSTEENKSIERGDKGQSIKQTNVLRHKCDDCGKRFNQTSMLIRHKRKVHNNLKPFQCDDCGKAFNQSSSLVNHKRIHTGEKPYKCDICGKVFKRLFFLVQHNRIHTGEKPHKCDTCGKTFSQKINLIRHKNTHTGERPHKCDICGRAFSVKTNINRHKRIHTGEKPYKCDICGKTFSQSNTLVHHNRIHTREKSHKCDTCGKTCSRKTHLIQHKRTHQ